LGVLAYSCGSLIPGMIAHAGLDIINFSYWWTDLAGHFDQRPVADSGIDIHFILWVLFLVFSIVAFFWIVRKSRAAIA
jgi:hypothetical protein